MKRRLASIVCLLLVLGVFSSCGLVVINYPGAQSETAATETTAAEADAPETEAPYEKVKRDKSHRAGEYLATIEDEHWDGAAIKIASSYPALTDPDSAPQIISYAVAERNRLVEEKLGVTVTTEAADVGKIYAELSASAKSGMYYANLIMLPQDSVMTFATAGLLFNLRSLPDFDLGEPYFNASSVEAASAGYECYAVAGEMTLEPYDLFGMFFASDRLAGLGLDAPYSLVAEGKWTLDEYFTLAAASGEYAPVVTGRCGDEAVDAIYRASGAALMTSGVRKYPTVALSADTVDDAAALLSRVFGNSGALTRDAGGIDAFASRGLFMVDRLNAIYTLSTSGERWGLLPLPKTSAGQESYIAPASGDALMIAVPAGLYADVQSAKALRTIAAASAGRIPAAFVEHTQYELLQNNESALMLDVILENVRYDFAYTAGDMFPNTASATYFALRNAVFDGASASAAVAYYAPICEAELAAAFRMD